MIIFDIQIFHMKLYYFSFITTLFFLVACGSSDSSQSSTTSSVSASTLSDNPDYKKGLGLVGKSNCFTCHHIDNKLVGPAYRDIANKYASESTAKADELADKVIKGGVGVWGNVPMPGHPELTKEDALAMVKYVLLLKSK